MKILSWIEKAHILVGSLGGVATMIMIFSILPDVFARNFLGISIAGVSEFNVALLVTLVFVGLAGAQVQGSHFRVSLIDSILGESRAFRVTRIFTAAISIAIFSLTLKATSVQAISSAKRGEYTFGDVQFPIWPFKIIVSVGIFMLLVQLVVDLMRLVLKEDNYTEQAKDS